MARTASHVPYTRRDENHHNHDVSICEPRSLWGGYGWTCAYTGPAHSITDLRYSAATLATAETVGARPAPTQVTTVLERQGFARSQARPGMMRYYANERERAYRARLRTDLVAARAAANTALSLTDWTDLDDDLDDDLVDQIDIVPARHRHSARWDVC